MDTILPVAGEMEIVAGVNCGESSGRVRTARLKAKTTRGPSLNSSCMYSCCRRGSRGEGGRGCLTGYVARREAHLRSETAGWVADKGPGNRLGRCGEQRGCRRRRLRG